MKKTVSFFLAWVLILALPMTAFAADAYTDSPSKSPVPLILDAHSTDANFDAAWLAIFPFLGASADQAGMTPEMEAEFGESYRKLLDIMEAPGERLAGLQDIAAEQDAVGQRLEVSDFFYIVYHEEDADLVAYDADADVMEEKRYTLKLASDTFCNFAALLHYVDGEWTVVEPVIHDADTVLAFSCDALGSFAVLAGVSAPDGAGICMTIVLIGIAIFLLLLLLLFVFFRYGKKLFPSKSKPSAEEDMTSEKTDA